MSLPGTTLEEEIRRCNAAFDAVAAYCPFLEGMHEQYMRIWIGASRFGEEPASDNILD
jgi:hypothetical protein